MENLPSQAPAEAPVHDPYVRPNTSKRRGGLKLWLLGLAVLALLGTAVTTATVTVVLAKSAAAQSIGSENLPVPRGSLTDAEKHTTGLFKRAAPSVVFITRLQTAPRRFRMRGDDIPAGTGSGFIWDKRGHIVTNYHVIRKASGAKVTLADRTTWKAKLVGSAVDKDLAVLRIDAPAERLTPIKLGGSDDLQVGQHVLAIGNPFGLDHTLSTGVISGLGREIKSVAGHPISGVIQTDAAINPGNSGGPLLDSSGRLIGVNTSIYSPSGASAGIGFAVPADTVNRIVPDLIKHGRRMRPGLGIEVADNSLSRRLKLSGVLVMNVPAGSAADKAGLIPTRRDPRTGGAVLGDVIIKVEDRAIRGNTDLYKALDRRKIGDVVSVTVMRGNQRVTLKLPLVVIDAGK